MTLEELNLPVDLHACWTCRGKTFAEITHTSQTDGGKLYRCVSCKAIYPSFAIESLSLSREQEQVQAETYRQMHEIARELGYPSLLEALEALSSREATVGTAIDEFGHTDAFDELYQRFEDGKISFFSALKEAAIRSLTRNPNRNQL